MFLGNQEGKGIGRRTHKHTHDKQHDMISATHDANTGNADQHENIAWNGLCMKSSCYQ